MKSEESKNLTWHSFLISPEEREERLGQCGAVLWFTGYSGSGKSTLANHLARSLFDAGALVTLLDGDNIRQGLNRDLGFTPEERRENIRRIGEVAKLFADTGILACTAFISPYRSDRQAARSRLAPGRFVEIFCHCSLAECERRDPKGLYRRARNGEIPQFTGISAPYEEPENPEIVVDTAQLSVKQSTEKILTFLCQAGIFPRKSPPPVNPVKSQLKRI